VTEEHINNNYFSRNKCTVFFNYGDVPLQKPYILIHRKSWKRFRDDEWCSVSFNV